MGKRRLSFALVGAASVLAGVAPQACRSKDAGAVIVAMQSDMDVPKDITHVGVFVSSDGIVKVATIVPATEQGDGRRVVKLPSTMAIVSNEDKPDAKVRVRVMAFQKDTATGKLKARVTRDARTTVPKERRALLRMPLRFISDGSAQGTIDEKQFSEVKPLGFEVNDEFSNSFGLGDKLTFTCPDGQTEIAGVCKPADVDSAALPEFKEEEVFGGATAAAAATAGECFNPAKVYKGAEEIKPAFNEATGDCTLALSSPQPADKLNFAFWTRNDKGGSGVCVPNEDPAKVLCFVPLDGEGSDEPLWTVAPGGGTPDAVTKVLFSPRVCQKLKADGIKLGRPAGPNGPLAIRAKTDKIPLCGGAVAGKEVNQDSAGQGDARFDAGGPEAGIVDAGGKDAGDGGVAGPFGPVEAILTGPNGGAINEYRLSGLAVVETGPTAGLYFVRQAPPGDPRAYQYQLRYIPFGQSGIGENRCALGTPFGVQGFGAAVYFQAAARPEVVGLVKRVGAADFTDKVTGAPVTAFACRTSNDENIIDGVPPANINFAATVVFGDSTKWLRRDQPQALDFYQSGLSSSATSIMGVGLKSMAAAATVPGKVGPGEAYIAAGLLTNGPAAVERCTLGMLLDGGSGPWSCVPLANVPQAEALRVVTGAEEGYFMAGSPPANATLYRFNATAITLGTPPVVDTSVPFFREQGMALSANGAWLFYGTTRGLRARRLSDSTVFDIPSPNLGIVGEVAVSKDSVYWVSCEPTALEGEKCNIYRATIPQ